MKQLTAKEALDIANEAREENLQLDWILDLILDVSKAGFFEVSVYENLGLDTESALTNLGYTITQREHQLQTGSGWYPRWETKSYPVISWGAGKVRT